MSAHKNSRRNPHCLAQKIPISGAEAFCYFLSPGDKDLTIHLACQGSRDWTPPCVTEGKLRPREGNSIKNIFPWANFKL